LIAASRGAARVRLRVHHANARARHLYESLGYVYAGKDRGELVMVRDLAEERQVTDGSGNSR
jgi:RimJ/RimL family protein N-acetyltransferase